LLLERGVPKVYALARDPSAVRQDTRVVPVAFDLLDAASIQTAAAMASDATLLINNASTAAFAGPLDADPVAVRNGMPARIDAPKTPPVEVAAGILDGLVEDDEDIFPDPNAQAMSQTWWSDPKSFERAFSGTAAA
jgi:NADP-dependent 3-hydroxy acid dehydrogenase YdfG